MESVAKALGLPADASEAEILKSVMAVQADAATAARTVEAQARDVAQANDRAAAAEKRADEVERAGVMAEIKAARKWSPSLDAFLATQSTAQLRAWLESAPAVVPAGEIKPPGAPPAADAQIPVDVAALVARAHERGWAALTAREKHLVEAHDAALAARLRAADR